MFFKTKNFSKTELNRFRELQKICFSLQLKIAAQLSEGMDEKAATKIMMQEYRAAGVGNFFHLPVALFGPRAALPGKWRVGQFFPKANTLKINDSVILDASPLFDGYMVDTSYSFCFGQSASHAQMMRDLLAERQLILSAVNQGQTFAKIAEDVYTRAKAKGYDSAHEKHPGEVLGHRAGRWLIGGNKGWRYNGFDGATLFWFIAKGKIAKLGLKTQTPLWNRSATSDHKPTDGLWLVEPHFGKDGVGAKWEEILVIENGQAQWLQDDPPYLHPHNS